MIILFLWSMRISHAGIDSPLIALHQCRLSCFLTFILTHTFSLNVGKYRLTLETKHRIVVYLMQLTFFHISSIPHNPIIVLIFLLLLTVTSTTITFSLIFFHIFLLNACIHKPNVPFNFINKFDSILYQVALISVGFKKLNEDLRGYCLMIF